MTSNPIVRKLTFGGSAGVIAGSLDFDDVLREDHLLAADPGGVVGRGEIAREDPHPVERVGHYLGGCTIDEAHTGAGLQQSDVDRIAHSAARATRQVASSCQLSASINS